MRRQLAGGEDVVGERVTRRGAEIVVLQLIIDGAGHLLDRNIAYAIEAAGITLAQALALATCNPGRFAGGRGLLRPGQRADITRFFFSPGDEKLTIQDVFLAGERMNA